MKDKPNWCPTGHRVYYYEDGQTKRYEGDYVEGVKNGVFTFYTPDGKKRAVMEYEDGVLVRQPKLYDSGNLHTSVVYNFDYGLLLDSSHYNNGNIIAHFNFEDKNNFNDPDLPTPPPVGTLWQGDSSIENPADLFRGTIWSFVKNAYHIDDNGNEKPVTIWLREPNTFGGGALSLGPYLLMNEFNEMWEDGIEINRGIYSRKVVDGQSTSWIDDEEILSDHDTGLPVLKIHWNMGDQFKAEILQLYKVDPANQKVWQEVNIANRKLVDGIISIHDVSQDIHTVLVPTFKFSYDQSTQECILKQYHKDTMD